MKPTEPRRVAESPQESIMKSVEQASGAEHVALRSGRRYELVSGDVVDSITVRSAAGRVLLRVTVGDKGPLLSFENAEITLCARNRLALSAPEVAISAGALRVRAGSCQEVVEGDRHSRVGGEHRQEAGAVAIQANEGRVGIRAMGHIALDGEHIGLNDDPCPRPFDWSVAHEESSR